MNQLSVGIDQSVTRTGYATNDGISTGCGSFSPSTKADQPLYRLKELYDWLKIRICLDNPRIIVMEGYSFASKGQGLTAVHELGGIFRLAIAQANKQLVIVAPSTLKKFAGAKDEKDMTQKPVDWCRKRYGAVVRNQDEGDACVLAEIGHILLTRKSQYILTNRQKEVIALLLPQIKGE